MGDANMIASTVISGGGASLGAALRAPWQALRRRARGVEIPSQEGGAVGVGVILFLSVLEIVLVDVMLSTPWSRLLALAAGLAASYLMVGFAVALSVFPHRVSDGTLTLAYGASFHVCIPVSLIREVAARRTFSDQQRTAAIKGGVLSVPVMSTSNVVLTLREPVRVEAGKATGTVQEIRFHALDPAAAAQAVRDALDGKTVEEAPKTPAPKTSTPTSAAPLPAWLRRLRWAGLIVLLVEILLVATGLLDWRIAAGVLVVTEGTLAVLGLVFGAALVNQYRKLRRTGRGRGAALGEAFFSLLPPPIAEMVRHELSVWGILARAATFRTQAGRGETLLGRNTIGALPAATAVLLAAGGVSLVVGVGANAFTLVSGILLEYGAAAAAAFALAGRVRPHTVGAGRIVLRWGTHQGVCIPLESVTGVEIAPLPEAAAPSESSFRVPGRAADALVLQLGEPVEVPARLGIMRPVTTVVVPVSNGVAARAAVAEHHGESP
ncbi:hypothetical protein ACIPRL_37475 [Streptomyces sp. NPDC090085]|uniref:hypothetical protein n=1 Tax=Streptomyces sp. NPDC090085 TaxID=3365943 RepID=UPI00381E03A9